MRQVDYVYDALGRRIKVIEGATTTYRVFAFNNMTATVTKDGVHPTATARYLVGPGLDDVYAAKVGSVTRYLHRDQLGSIRMISDAAGSVIATQSYSLFGRTVVTTGTNDAGLGFTARPIDVGTGMVDLRARMLDPTLGRFDARDPVSTLSQGTSLYAYAENLPLVLTDPTGLCAGPPPPPPPFAADDYSLFFDPASASAQDSEDFWTWINDSDKPRGLLTGVNDISWHEGEGFDYVVHTSVGNFVVDVLFSLPGLDLARSWFISATHPELSDPSIQWSGHSAGGMTLNLLGIDGNLYGTPGMIGQAGTGTGHAWSEYIYGPTSRAGVVNPGDLVPYLPRTMIWEGVHGEPVLGLGWTFSFGEFSDGSE